MVVLQNIQRHSPSWASAPPTKGPIPPEKHQALRYSKT